jgi:hypothetical protein
MKQLINTLFEIREMGADLVLTTSNDILVLQLNYTPKEKNKFGFSKQATIDLNNQHANIIMNDIDTELKICFQKAKDEYQQITMDLETSKA